MIQSLIRTFDFFYSPKLEDHNFQLFSVKYYDLSQPSMKIRVLDSFQLEHYALKQSFIETIQFETDLI